MVHREKPGTGKSRMLDCFKKAGILVGTRIPFAAQFLGMTKPYPTKGELIGLTVDNINTLKRATALTKKYGVSVLFLDELDAFEDKTGDTMPENEWTPDWPTEPGWYWFYGHRYGSEMVSMNTVHVKPTSDGIVRVMDGAFMYQQEKHRGVFQRIPTPVVPAEIAGGNLLA